MKKTSLIITAILLLSFSAHAQMHVTVPLSDSVYEFLDIAQKKGACSQLNSYKPYTKAQIIDALWEINGNSEVLSEREAKIAQDYLELYDPKEKVNKKNILEVNYTSPNEDFPASFNYKSDSELIYSGGLYSNSEYNSFGMDNIFNIKFDGDLGKALSYKLKAVIDFTYMPLKEISNYKIGYAWYADYVEQFCKGEYKDEAKTQKYDVEDKARYIRRYLNNSYLPYSYKKPWSGQFYFLNNLNAEGLEGWANSFGLGFSIDGEIRGSLFNNHIILGAGRFDREVAAMDDGASLVLNGRALPFLAVDAQFRIFDFLKFYSLTGILEYPNQDYINEDELNKLGSSGSLDDSYYYQNAFSLNMIELDLKRLHLDFGSTVIWPKRFELGYAFPLANYVEYQNHIGDCDNLQLFGDIKYTISGVGSVWASVYVDEINGLNNNPFNSPRAMLAYQAGVKALVPNLPFGTLSFRYTKIEPYCYTHQALPHTPWYNHYICENYSNNGESLGYYLPPNSDEFLLSFKIHPGIASNLGVSYQLIRHGADYGSQQVPGSNIYSELTPWARNELNKYFLHDGAYNWIHILSTGGKLSLNTKIPVAFYGNLGLMFSYFTVIDPEKYYRDDYGKNGNCRDVDFKTPFDIAGTDEYPNLFGAVLTLGVNINF